MDSVKDVVDAVPESPDPPEPIRERFGLSIVLSLMLWRWEGSAPPPPPADLLLADELLLEKNWNYFWTSCVCCPVVVVGGVRPR